MSILGIVPSAGEGTRWGGYCKELLPVDRTTLIDRTITSMKGGGAEKIAVITKPDKIAMHSKYLTSRHGDIFYLIQRYPELMGAVREALPYSMDWNFFAMPDTYFPRTIFMGDLEYDKDFYLGLFDTTTPERFGVLQNGMVWDKRRFPVVDKYEAWGILIWNKKVSEFWWETQPEDFNIAINLAIENFNWDTFKLGYYYDMASWEDYEEFIKNGLSRSRP